MRAMDCRTSSAGSRKDSGDHDGQAGVLLDLGLEVVVGERQHAAVGVVDQDDLACTEQALADGQRADCVLGDDTPALRMTWASPSCRPSSPEGFSRASMHARTATCRAGGMGTSPLSNVLA